MSLKQIIPHEEELFAGRYIKYYGCEIHTCNQLFKELIEKERQNPVERTDPKLLYVI